MHMLLDAVRVLAWPGVLLSFMILWHECRVQGRGEQQAMALAYGLALVLTCLLERVLPYRREWNSAALDGRVDAYPVLQDLAHTAVTAVSIEGAKAACEFVFVRWLRVRPWLPAVRALPLWPEVALALVAFEFGAYWQHRLSHTCSYLWPFHAVHHSVPRLHALNTGRFHFLNQVRATILGFPCLFLVGFSDGAIYEVTGLLAAIGLLSHCNVDMRCGALSLVFNTPEQHRWHHSARVNESNANYGENLMIFDHVFGTFFNGEREPDARRGPTAVGRVRYCDHARNRNGCSGGGTDNAGDSAGVRGLVRLPKTFAGQLVAPFASNPLRGALRSRKLGALRRLLLAAPGPSDPYDSTYYPHRHS